MKVLDWAWYMHYRFTFHVCKGVIYEKDKAEGKWSATLLFATATAFFVDIFIKVYGYVYDYDFLIKYWYGDVVPFLFIGTGVICVIYFYYIHKPDIDNYEEAYASCSPCQRKLLWLFWVCISIIPLFVDLAMITFKRPA